LLSSRVGAHLLEDRSSIIIQDKSTLSVGAWVIDKSGIVLDWLPIGVAFPGWTIHGIGDFNRDQIPDILFQNNETWALGVWTWNGTEVTSWLTIATYKMSQWVTYNLYDGTEVTSWLTIDTSDPTWKVVGVGDFDGDGQDDILLRNTSTHAVGALRMDGSAVTSFIPINPGSPNRAGWTIRGIGDFKGDGVADILWQNDTTKALIVWLWNRTRVTTLLNIITPGADWEIQGIHDFDNDGHQDILFYNIATGAVVAWRMHENKVIKSIPVHVAISTEWAIYGIAGPLTPRPIDRALKLTQKVRHMADRHAVPFKNTPLAEVTREYHNDYANCGVQSILLARLLPKAQLGGARTHQLAFDPNGFETHVVVEWYNKDQKEWIVLDPTYGVAVTRLRDKQWATVADISEATVNQAWNSLDYVFLTQWGDDLVRTSYIDYPLNYLSSYGSPAPGSYKLGVGNSVLNYLEEVPFPLDAVQPGFYILRNTSGVQERVFVDGIETLVQFDGVDQTSRILQKVRRVQPSNNSSSNLKLYKVKRFVFPYEG
jgi:hypothetical protein